MATNRRDVLATLTRFLFMGTAGLRLANQAPVQALPITTKDRSPHLPHEGRILFQGDSITDGGRGRNDDPNHIFGQDYAYLIAAYCGGHFPDRHWTFINRGVSGNKVTDLAAR